MNKSYKRRYSRTSLDNQLNKNKTVDIDISPNANMLVVNQSAGYTTSQAFCDINDNSTDAAATRVDLHIQSRDKIPRVIIADNGFGMDMETLAGCLVMGATEQELGDKRKGKPGDGMTGKFGVGLNESIAQFQGNAYILSKMNNGAPLLKVSYNESEIVELYNKLLEEDKSPRWKIPMDIASDDEIKFFEEYTNGSKHGTVVVIHDVNRFNIKSNVQRKDHLIKEVARIFRYFIQYNKTQFYVNGVKVSAYDPMVYDIPISWTTTETDPVTGKSKKKKVVLRSEILSDKVFKDIEYVDKDGNLKKDGWIKYRSYCLPLGWVHDKDTFAKKYKWNWANQGISVVRNNREITWGKTFGIINKNSKLNRFRVEIHYSPEMDHLWGLDFKKTRVDPNDDIKYIFAGIFANDATRARKKYDKMVKLNKQPNHRMKKWLQYFGNHMTGLKSILPALPPKTRKPYTGQRKTIQNPGSRGTYNKSDLFRLEFFDGPPTGRAFEGEIGIDKNKQYVLWMNANHRLYTEYMETVSDSQRSAVAGFIVAFIQAKYRNLPDGKAGDAYLQRFEHIENEMGALLDLVLKDAPGYIKK
jgi:ribosomal protein S17E